MGKWKYRKKEAVDIQGTCVKCNKNKQKQKSKGRGYHPLCSSCEVRLYRKTKPKRPKDGWPIKPHRRDLKLLCLKCGFTSEYRCQFDIDHIDGNHFNNDPSNLQELCANCHRLKTYLNKDTGKRRNKITLSD